jgi:hypothetical protein
VKGWEWEGELEMFFVELRGGVESVEREQERDQDDDPDDKSEVDKSNAAHGRGTE